MRLNQAISSAGICSRRQADEYIKSGRVTVNGQYESLYYMTDETDVIRLDGEVIDRTPPRPVYVMLHKPAGIVSTAAPDVADNIIDYVDHKERIFPVGRLDRQTTGLILLTNDGPLANDLLKVEHAVEKEYEVTVNRQVTESFLEDLRQGVSIYNPRVKGHTITEPCTATQQGPYTFTLTIKQGLNRQIRRMCRRFQYTVTELKRIRLKTLQLGDLPEGEWRELTPSEVNELKATSHITF